MLAIHSRQPLYQTILVPLDGSALGELALPVAEALARKADAQLVLVRSVWKPETRQLDPVQAQFEDVQAVKVYLADIARRLGEQGRLVTRAFPDLPPAHSILSEIEHHQADLVVMSTHGRSGLGRWIFGSVAEAVLARSPVPVWLVRGIGRRPPDLFEVAQPRILVPLDGSPFGEAALPHAKALARLLDATVVLLHVLPGAAPLEEEEPNFEAQGAGADLADDTAAMHYLVVWAERLRLEGVRVQTTVLTGPAPETIIQASQVSNIDLIVMGTHGRSGLPRVVLGSVALEVLRRGALPTVLVRPTGLVHPERLGESEEPTR